MATATIISTGVCAGGNHLGTRTTIGAQNFDHTWLIDDLRVALTAEDVYLATSILTRFHCQGMTKAQAKAELVSPGISVVTS